MLKVYSVFAIFILTFLPLMLTADDQEVNVTGTWEMTMKGPRGERTWDVKFVQEGEKLTVTMKGFRGREMKGEGTVKGNEIEWSFTFSGPRGEFTSTYKGTVEGDKMSGQTQMGNFPARDWKAKRKETKDK